MKEKLETPKTDAAKWGLMLALLAIAVGGYYYYSQYSVLFRAIGLLAAFAVAAVIGYTTIHGKRFWEFAVAARLEIRKVVWPSRQETTQATLLVLTMVVVMGLVLWAIDSILLRIVAWVTGGGGS